MNALFRSTLSLLFLLVAYGAILVPFTAYMGKKPVEGELLNVNTYDQPGVEGYKNYMYYKLEKPGIPEDVVKEIRKNPLKKKEKYII